MPYRRHADHNDHADGKDDDVVEHCSDLFLQLNNRLGIVFINFWFNKAPLEEILYYGIELH